MTITTPSTDLDPYSDAAILEPYELYRTLRDLGPAVRLDRYDAWAVARYRDVYDALHDHETFISGAGVGLTDELNRRMAGAPITMDPPDHTKLRAVVGKPLQPRELRKYKESVRERAEGLVDLLIERGAFDAVVDFAQVFPLSVVPDLFGWPEEGRDRFLAWASAGFNALGPLNERTRAGFPALGEMWEYLARMAAPGALKEDGWAAGLLAAAEDGTISREALPTLLGDYLTPSLDTTVSALSSALWLFGAHPDQWDKVRTDPSLVPNAFNEVIRLESPARGFTRQVAKDRTLSGVDLPAGTRVLLLYGSANRDERQWTAADEFDVTRADASAHIAFGHGVHGCMGQGLARMEAHALLTALAAKVRRIEVGEPTWRLHNTIRGIESMQVTLHV
ncbi:cytochrome P450 [Thermomonospora umbrina]|uniref:Cytochrome P450 n=1 Tax=Thermomonospora umbrina TaxID=111806 RepID=A0A3D9T3K6_9ACTN|nr:cytochrome P450 [Thermomonospora umbrina]REF00954.1 cytochrome P450 [Thermomonospora umbrina]